MNDRARIAAKLAGAAFADAVFSKASDEEAFADVLALATGTRGLSVDAPPGTDLWKRAARAALEVVRAEPSFRDLKE